MLSTDVVIDEIVEPIAVPRNRATVGRALRFYWPDGGPDGGPEDAELPPTREPNLSCARVYRSTASSSSCPGPRCASSEFMTTATT
jgi:hypothetical protein